MMRRDMVASEPVIVDENQVMNRPHRFEVWEGMDANDPAAWCRHCCMRRDEVPGLHSDDAPDWGEYEEAGYDDKHRGAENIAERISRAMLRGFVTIFKMAAITALSFVAGIVCIQLVGIVLSILAAIVKALGGTFTL